MVKVQVIAIVAALFIVTIAVNPSFADNGTCKHCMGDSFVQLIDKYAEKRECWFNKDHQFVIKLKIWNLDALIANFVNVLNANNQVIKAECKREALLKQCERNEVDSLSQCLMNNLQTVVRIYRDQEQCNGKPIKSKLLKIAAKLIFGSFEGWDKIHPDC
uniref:Uncharacterized protein n=1 Tax=Stomoxys calcitrans TaxID=35570 RepID=A0A1I8QEZ7_STOCA